MQQVGFCFLTSATSNVYVCMHERVNGSAVTLPYQICLCEKAFREQRTEITFAFDSDTILVSSHRFTLYIYFIWLFYPGGPRMISIRHAFFIALLLNRRGVTQLLRCSNVFCCLGTVLLAHKKRSGTKTRTLLHQKKRANV